ncbi:MAG: glycoside hydrolase family 29 (alpha-L-fucosidase), partial [Candidatus Solibacter sp.]|nr:glycoside hydrolase family 29 (alpha-L-fucosidase) [Candidatus Solibacter sp.]
KTPEFFVRLLVKAAARGGNLLLNIGPMGNGEIDPKDQAILRGVGKWMSTNGGSIYGTVRTPLAPQAWGEMTLKGSTLYLHVFDWPREGKIAVAGTVVNLPARAPDAIDSVIPLTLKGPLTADPVRLLSTTQRNVLGTFDAQTTLKFTDGKAPHAYCFGWTTTEQTLVWPARLNAAGEFEVWAKYSTGTPKDGGRFVVEIGGQRVEATVEATAKDTEAREVKLGTVKVPSGAADVRVRAVKIDGSELMRLFSVTLRP